MNTSPELVTSELATGSIRSSQIGGIAIIIASVVMVFAMLHHPAGSAHHLDELIDEIESMRVVNPFVHGGAIFLMGVFVFGFSLLSSRLGINRSSVRLAMISFGFGALMIGCAASISGFLVPNYLEGYQGASAGRLAIAGEVLRLAREANQICDEIGVFGISLGVLFWAFALLSHKSPQLLSGAIGVVVGLVGIAGLFTGQTAATLSGVIVFASLLGIWSVAVGIAMIRQKI